MEQENEGLKSVNSTGKHGITNPAEGAESGVSMHIWLAESEEANAPEAASVPLPPDINALLHGKRVVVCEDEGITQLQLRRVLTRAGMQVVGAAINGQEAVDIVLRERPDLVLMDIYMPLIDGLEAARRILETQPVCIIMLTAFSDEDYLRRAQEVGASGYVVKPITGDTLLPQIRTAYQAYQRKPH